MSPKRLLLITLMGAFITQGLWAQLAMPQFFSDDMIVQRQRPIRVWGSAAPFETVRISLNQTVTIATADEHGEWRGFLSPMVAGGPYSLEVAGQTDTLEFQNVLVGEIWICAGQSNMERPLKIIPGGTQAAAHYPEIRLLHVTRDMAASPKDDILPTRWRECTPTTAGNFSAVGYFFGRRLYEELGVPIGLIDITWGGTGIDTWLPPEIAVEGEVSVPVVDLEAIQDSIEQLQDTWEEQVESTDIGWQQGWATMDMSWQQTWPTMNVPGIWEARGLHGYDGSVWFKRTFYIPASLMNDTLELILGRIDDSDQTFINGQLVGETLNDPGFKRRYSIPPGIVHEGHNEITIRVTDLQYVGGLLGGDGNMRITNGGWIGHLNGDWHYQQGTPNLPPKPLDLKPNDYPSLLYNGMVAPLECYTMRGVAWYQGEADLNEPYHYRYRLPELIDAWRDRWDIGEFPFLYVQLPNFRPPVTQPSESSWATMRESQSKALEVPRTGMAITIDVGDSYNIHPPDKESVGERLSLEARRNFYYESSLPTAPSLNYVTLQDSQIMVHFRDAGDGLMLLDESQPLNGFAVAGEDGKFFWAEAELTGPNRVVVRSPQVPDPKYVRYAWSDNPGTLNLYGPAGLPAAPFRTDTFTVPWQ